MTLAAPARDEAWHLSLGLGYILTVPSATFSDITETTGGTTYSGNADLKYKPTYELMVEAQKLPAQHWGLMAGLNYEGERELDSGTVTISGTSVGLSGGSGASKVQFTTVYGNAVYRWDEFYIPFGLNYSLLKFTPASGATESYSANGGVGAQLGVGWRFPNNIELEAYSWVTSMNLKDSGSSTSVDYGNGYFPSLRVYLKYVFN